MAKRMSRAKTGGPILTIYASLRNLTP